MVGRSDYLRYVLGNNCAMGTATGAAEPGTITNASDA